MALVQVGRGGRRDRHERAAPQRLDQSGRDELVEALRGAGEERPDGERDEGAEEQPAGAPQVGQAPGQGIVAT